MKVLVTGISGHIGGAIATHLINLGWDIVGLDRIPCRIKGVTKHLKADIGSLSFLKSTVSKIAPCAGIVHAAATLETGLYTPSVSATNCLGTQQLLKLAEEWQVQRFIFLSSIPVIGRPRQQPITEEHPVDPQTAYHASKLFGEHLIRIANRRKEIGAILRLSSPIGPKMPANRILSVFIKQALSQAPIKIIGQGTRQQNYVDVRDIAQAVELCLKQQVSGLFNIAGGKNISNLELAKTCIRVLNSSSPVQFSGQPDPEEGVIWNISIEKAVRQFGYQPQYNIENTIQSLALKTEIK